MISKPPPGAPLGTIWFGGAVSWVSASLRVFGPTLVAADVSALLRCEPTIISSVPRRAPRKHGWLLRLARSDGDVDALVSELLARVTSNLRVWKQLNAAYRVDLVYGVFLGSTNQGLELAPETMRMLTKRGLTIGFDIYAPEV